MGRGRAKAKQQKVARELKYYSPSTDFSVLERELHGATKYSPAADDDVDEVDDDEADGFDDYGKWAQGQR